MVADGRFAAVDWFEKVTGPDLASFGDKGSGGGIARDRRARRIRARDPLRCFHRACLQHRRTANLGHEPRAFAFEVAATVAVQLGCNHVERDLLARAVAADSIAANRSLRAYSFHGKPGAKPALVAERSGEPVVAQQPSERTVCVRSPPQRFGEARGTDRHEHEQSRFNGVVDGSSVDCLA
jgi:hypothetical protein